MQAKLSNMEGQRQGFIYSCINYQEIEDLSSNMEFFQLKHIGREANEAAHLCAKQAS
jgi:hypothetical protein